MPAAVIRAHAQRRRALVLDYGAGTGLLSLMAAKAARAATPDIAAPRILGIEKDADLAAVAERVILDNGERVEVVVGDAGELGAGLPLDERADALLVEMFDCGGLGERVLHFVGQAWRHALRPDAEVVPRRCAVRACLVALADDDAAAPWLPYGHDPGSCVYRPETVVEGGAWVALTAPATVAAFDLGDRAAFVGADSPESGGAAAVAWTATRSGVVAGVLSWFVLDCDDESSLTTLPPALGFQPDGARTAAHWPAALQPLDRRRLDVGEAAALAATHRGTRVAFAWARDPRPAPGDDLWRVLKARNAARVRELLHAAGTPSPRMLPTADAIFALARDPDLERVAFEDAAALASALVRAGAAWPVFPKGGLAPGAGNDANPCACF